MTSAHFIFIPGVLLIGVIVGFFLGGRAARDAFDAEQKRKEKRAARRAAETTTSNEGGKE